MAHQVADLVDQFVRLDAFLMDFIFEAAMKLASITGKLLSCLGRIIRVVDPCSYVALIFQLICFSTLFFSLFFSLLFFDKDGQLFMMLETSEGRRFAGKGNYTLQGSPK